MKEKTRWASQGFPPHQGLCWDENDKDEKQIALEFELNDVCIVIGKFNAATKVSLSALGSKGFGWRRRCTKNFCDSLVWIFVHFFGRSA